MQCEKSGEILATRSKGLANESVLWKLCRIKAGENLEQVLFIQSELFWILPKAKGDYSLKTSLVFEDHSSPGLPASFCPILKQT